MRSLSSSVVICNISMRWRNCGVSTSRWERLVVNLRDIPQIRLPLYRFIFSDLSRLVAAREDYNRSAAFSVQSLCTLCLCGENLFRPNNHRDTEDTEVAQSFKKTFTCGIFRPGKVCALPSLQ